jgi:hypothetical protein
MCFIANVGRECVKAELIAIDGDKAFLKRLDGGRNFEVPLNKVFRFDPSVFRDIIAAENEERLADNRVVAVTRKLDAWARAKPLLIDRKEKVLWFAMAWDDWVLMSGTPIRCTQEGEPIHEPDHILQFKMTIEGFTRQFGFMLVDGHMVEVELPLGRISAIKGHGFFSFTADSTDTAGTVPPPPASSPAADPAGCTDGSSP